MSLFRRQPPRADSVIVQEVPLPQVQQATLAFPSWLYRPCPTDRCGLRTFANGLLGRPGSRRVAKTRGKSAEMGLTASEPRVLLTFWMSNSVQRITALPDYRPRLFEKPVTSDTADDAIDERILFEGVSGPYMFEHTGHFGRRKRRRLSRTIPGEEQPEFGVKLF